MPRSRSWRWRPGLALALVLALHGIAAAGTVEIITSEDHPGVSMDRSRIRAIFSVRLRQWPDGSPVRVFVLPDGDPLHLRFCREQLGTFPYVLRASWDRLVYTGTGIAPEIVSSEREMRERVASTRGAIGYISAPEATGALRASPPFIQIAKREKQ